MTARLHPEVSLYKRNAAYITDAPVLHATEKLQLARALPVLKRKKGRAELETKWEQEESSAAEEARERLTQLQRSANALASALDALGALRLPELRGKVEAEQIRVRTAQNAIVTALNALQQRDFGTAGEAAEEALRELWLIGGALIVTLNRSLGQAPVSREVRDRLTANVTDRKQARLELENTRRDRGVPPSIEYAAQVHRLEADGFRIAAEILAGRTQSAQSLRTKADRDSSLRVIPPAELETFADVGGLDDVKEQLQNTIGAILERPDEAARYRVVHNGILFHGPPGTGKTLLSRALAGEYGLRYIRFSPASIASAYIHEAAANLEKLFQLAVENVPCVLFLDEVDTIASARDDQPSADHREVVTQLMNSLEEYRGVPGLVICAATNNIDRLDPGLREGRFDAKILVPLPDRQARGDVIRVHLEQRGEAVDWSTIDLDELAELTAGRNAAALEGFVSLAAQEALRASAAIDQARLVGTINARGGKERLSLDDPVTWDEVVLDESVDEKLKEILNAFAHPELARSVGVRPPPGILLYGPPGTGKTTIARAIATEVQASFYERSAADLLSKWAGESEERVQKLFEKARANRPAIIFLDEVDGLLRKRTGESTTPWEERVVSQFLRELDGLDQTEGVLLVGATNRIDIIDPAIQQRRLVPIEIGLPGGTERLRLLHLLLEDVNTASDVAPRDLAAATEGMSGADLKRLRDAAGMKALNRATSSGEADPKISITMADLLAALEGLRGRTSLAEV